MTKINAYLLNLETPTSLGDLLLEFLATLYIFVKLMKNL